MGCTDHFNFSVVFWKKVEFLGKKFLLPDSPDEALLMYEALMQLQNLH